MKRKLQAILLILFGFTVATVLNSQSLTTSTEIDALKKQVSALVRTVDDLQKQVATLQSAIQVTSASVTIKSSSIEITSAADLKLKGTIISLNGGTKPVARAGDQVATPAGAGRIAQGSPTVLSN